MSNHREVTERLEAFVKNSVEPNMMADFLDKVMWGYAFYMLADEELSGHPKNIDALYWVKELRDVFVPKEN